VKRVAIAVFLCLVANAHAARFLFDAGHAETAGSADWVIDADLHNLSWTSAGTFTTSSGNDSNAQRIPTPPASGIIPSTTETYWQGALSAWAVDLVKRGHSVETLPAGLRFTYNTANAQDLTNYDVVVIDEPNIVFTLAEKQALLSFITNGGSLFMISDHAGSDRDNNGCDSVCVWNDFLTNNGLTNNPFGIVFSTNSAFPSAGNNSGTNTFSKNVAGVPLLFGPIGTATNVAYFNGNEFQIDNTKNPTAISHMWFGAASDSNNLCALASLQYGNGRVVVCGDSSPIEDGTGDPGDSLFNGYTGDMGGIQHIWIMNSSEWLAAPFAPVASPTNSWTNAASGKWETGANWLNGTPSSTDAADLITNATTKTVMIDAVTTNTAASLTISNLTVSGSSGTINTLQLTNAGVATPLTILNTATLGNGGAVLITNSAMRIASSLLARGALTVQDGGTLALAGSMQVGSGTVLVAGGQLVITNVPSNVGANTGLVVDGIMTLTNGSLVNVTNVDAVVGNRGSGALTNSGGLVLFANLIVGNFGGSRGTLTALNGSVAASGTLTLGKTAGSGGALWLNGGTLYVTNGVFPGNIVVGAAGQGTFVVSNGTAQIDQAYVGHGVGGSGTLTIAGGSYLSPNALTLGDFLSGTGTVWITGGMLELTNNISTANIFTHDGLAQLTVSNGTLTADVALISSLSLVGRGTFTFAGGTSRINTNIVLGNYGCGSGQGNVIMAGGSLFVTNASQTAVLEVRNGTLEIDSGTLVVDKLVMTNSCANFIRTGGTLVYGSLLLDPNADTDGDGIPNGYEQSHGLDPLNAADANLDPDGDGFSNLQEFLAGTDPTNNASYFHITSIVGTGNDVLINWMTGPGRTNALERSAGTAGGSYSNNFATIFTVTNTVGTITNYLDVGAATNFPASYYRVRLVP
jgi:hypothetical protein